MPSSSGKKKAKADSPRGTPATPATPETSPGNLQLAGDEQAGPAACAVLHWETLQQLGACLDDTLAISSSAGSGEVLLTAWASARVFPGRVGLAEEVRAALGVGKGTGHTSVHARLVRGRPAEARVVELCATSASEAEALESLGVHEGARLTWLSSQIDGWPVATGCSMHATGPTARRSSSKAASSGQTT